MSSDPIRRPAMVDIETFALGVGGVIFQIASVEFCPITYRAGREFFVNINPVSCARMGMHMDNETLQFWKERGVDWKALDGDSIRMALLSLKYFLTIEVQATEFWSRGSDFDFPRLAYAYKAIDEEIPWDYWRVRDVRTIWADAFPDVRPHQTAHHALQDCHEQIKQLAAADQEKQRQFRINHDLEKSYA